MTPGVLTHQDTQSLRHLQCLDPSENLPFTSTDPSSVGAVVGEQQGRVLSFVSRSRTPSLLTLLTPDVKSLGRPSTHGSGSCTVLDESGDRSGCPGEYLTQVHLSSESPFSSHVPVLPGLLSHKSRSVTPTVVVIRVDLWTLTGPVPVRVNGLGRS